jgi:transcription-repair coupling factor (superfamily II helicase)
MEVATAPDRRAGSLYFLTERLETHANFAEVIASLLAGHGATLGGVWGSSCALVAATLAQHVPATLVVVCPRSSDIDDFCDDLALFSAVTAERFPASGAATTDDDFSDDVEGDRLRVLKELGIRNSDFGAGQSVPHSALGNSQSKHSGLPILIASIQSLLQPVPSPSVLAEHTRRLKVGDEVDVPAFIRWLAENGFHNTGAVTLPGEFSPRGGIVDIFAPDWYEPVRVEFFGDAVESIRSFEVASQRSTGSLDHLDITVLKRSKEHRDYFTSYLPEQSWFLIVEPSELQEEARHYRQRAERPQDLHDTDDVLGQVYRFPSVTAAAVSAGSMETTCQLKIESVERFSGDIGKVREELDTAGLGNEVFVVCQTEAEVERLREVFDTARLAEEGRLHFPVGTLHAGFRLVSERIVLVSGGELFHRNDLSRPTRRRLGRVIDSFLELREGDHVVHLAHGIGRYRGMKLLEKHDQVEEHLEIEFHGGTRIFVPATNIDLVQKYVGGSKSRPTLAHIGGKTWLNQKAAAQRAVLDLAVEMLQLQALRESRPGIAFPPDSHWQQEFDAAFPYRETPDQLTAITAIKNDMQSPRPLDRLLCGDVGYGKTEVAMRGAFKAVDAGYQVAVLVPTTILAEQHRRTFTSRMAEFPFSIATLSRFSTGKQQAQVIEGLKQGTVDIVIGTHRLAQPDVSFANLGLLIIDEEQRFGVEVKERLKALRATVDVLTMTATPIPRTLHMALLGVRDISNLETPPEDRLAVETRIGRWDEELIRHAVMRELNRGGQIYFVHNRINDIALVAHKLQRIVPEANLVIGHGQMPEGQLEQVMVDFIGRKYDILLATTIIESGLDIPNANTIFIDEADIYGLADLHQLRGRVGRYKHRAYCYLLVGENKFLSTNSAKRLKAIEEFSDMGAGFAIAMRDLEIRGAGNILGTQQSGHIATVGYELYCELLEQAVRKLKRMPPKQTVDVHIDLPGEAYLPRNYVPDMRVKIDLYRRLSRVSTYEDLNDLSAEMLDRFGPHPPTVERLVSLAELRIAAAGWRIDTIQREDNYAVLRYADRGKIEELASRHPGKVRIVDERSAYIPLDRQTAQSERILNSLKALLRPD